MTDAERLNDEILAAHPAAGRMLSRLGRAAAFPRGIPWQAAQARGCRIDATIGQLTDGAGGPLPVPAVGEALAALDARESLLYAPLDGPVPLREAWRARQQRLAAVSGGVRPLSLPFVAHGLTHALSLVATLFADDETEVLVPTPAWENYDLVFTIHAGARVVRYEATGPGGAFSLEGLDRALSAVRGKAVLVLNAPSNPVGWMPTRAEAEALVARVAAAPGPLVVVCDDAYQGFVYAGDAHPRSLYWDLAERADPERALVVKVDGATKELVFFGSRVGFVAHSAAAADAALTDKLKFVVRGTVGAASSPALAATRAALADPRTDAAFEDRRRTMAGRWAALRAGLAALPPDRIRAWPFNGAFFALLGLDASLDADQVRRRLLADRSTGVIAFASHNALRVSYSAIAEQDLGALVDALAAAVL